MLYFAPQLLLGSGEQPSSLNSSCFASGSIVAAWTSNDTHSTLVTQTGSLGAMVLSGMATGLDVQCNTGPAMARLPPAANSVGMASAVQVDVTGDSVADVAMVLTNGSVVVAVNNGSDWYIGTTQVRWGRVGQGRAGPLVGSSGSLARGHVQGLVSVCWRLAKRLRAPCVTCVACLSWHSWTRHLLRRALLSSLLWMSASMVGRTWWWGVALGPAPRTCECPLPDADSLQRESATHTCVLCACDH